MVLPPRTDAAEHIFDQSPVSAGEHPAHFRFSRIGVPDFINRLRLANLHLSVRLWKDELAGIIAQAE